MADQKRKHHFDKRDKRGKRKSEEKVDEISPVIVAFHGYQQELDKRYDRYERIFKLSRDVTIESKRAIFLLHRVTGSEDRESLLQQALDKLSEIEASKFRLIAEELKDEDIYQFIRAYSSGLQEYIEALTFYYFLKNCSLIKLEDVQKRLTFTAADDSNSDETQQKTQKSVDGRINVVIPPIEYILGVADLTGELMRLTLNSVGKGDFETPYKVCDFMRCMHAAFVTMGSMSRDVVRKTTVLKQSLQKIENTCYTLQVRGSEIPKHMLINVFTCASSDNIPGYADEETVENDP
ncbi:hypothetical protein CHS0354_024223 [Potamilus streckersoni]|uniref:Translin-associated protein X n=1 Tax=Potamilus streckersoni TaxID=2493646 RepID=A0AAE0SCD0_9BIVA|nr:hypothetical protein CHS0354_024223 [Potamilus streckersoni]